MVMKKAIALLLALMMLLSLVACGGSKIADGTYSAEISDASAEANHGWKDFLTITYKDGEMVNCSPKVPFVRQKSLFVNETLLL